MRAAVIVFPGSNCDKDCQRAFAQVTGIEPDLVWHKENQLPNYDIVILPGGFSFGDYLRTGSIAQFSPVMDEVKRLAEYGSKIIGICNGFQILTEAGLLPGALLRNRALNFICKDHFIKVENTQTAFTHHYHDHANQVVRLPIAHAEGNYHIDDVGYQELEARNGVIFRYCSEQGECDDASNPNGARANIAGIINEKGNVLGMMPHPERMVSDLLGGTDGMGVFLSMVNERS